MRKMIPLLICSLFILTCEEKNPLPLDCAKIEGGNNICGCTDNTAANFNYLATYDNGSCAYPSDMTLIQQQVVSSDNSFGTGSGAVYVYRR